MNWCVQIDWNGTWVTVDQGYKTKDDAEWATARWKQANKCLGDPFRAAPIDGVALVNVVADTRPPTDVPPTFHKGDRLVVSDYPLWNQSWGTDDPVGFVEGMQEIGGEG